MNNSLKAIFLILIISFIPVTSFAQSDLKNSKKIEGILGAVKSNNQLKSTSATKKSTPNSNFNLNIETKLNTNAINKNLAKNNSNKNQNFLLETLPEDQDIIGKKFWNNTDVTHKKLASNFGLGTIYSTSNTVKIQCRDYSYVDGDRIRVYLNERVISDQIGLKSNYYTVYVDLDAGYNRIDFQAINQGLSGPNTAELNVYDDKGTLISSKEWNLTTGQTATLGIIKK